MTNPLRTQTRRRLVIAGVWLSGLAVIWWLVPVGPGDRWQPPTNEFVCNSLNDSRTLVTIPRSATGKRAMGTPESGPIRLWDIETGELRAAHFTAEDVFHRVKVVQQQDWLQIEQRQGDSGDHNFRLRLHDAWTGQMINEFACHVPQDNVWWVHSADGRTTAYVTFDNDKPRVEWRDVASGKLLKTLSGWSEVICFSPDGRRFAASRRVLTPSGWVSTIGVWEVPSGRELTVFTAQSSSPDPCDPKEFSPDGNFLLDTMCQVWDIGTGQLRFQLPGDHWNNSSLFSPDGRYLVVLVTCGAECSLVYYDLSTGKELKEKRVPLVKGVDPRMHLGPATPDRNMLFVWGIQEFRRPTQWQQWVAKAPGLKHLGDAKQAYGFILVETKTGRVVNRGDGWAWSCTPDGRCALTQSNSEVTQLWDVGVPPRKSLRQALLWAAVWTAPVALLALRRRRPKKERTASAPSTESARAPT